MAHERQHHDDKHKDEAAAKAEPHSINPAPGPEGSAAKAEPHSINPAPGPEGPVSINEPPGSQVTMDAKAHDRDRDAAIGKAAPEKAKPEPDPDHNTLRRGHDDEAPANKRHR